MKPKLEDPHRHPDSAGGRPYPTPLRAIRERCLDCSGGSSKEVKLCPVTDCPLWPYRLGKRPATVLAAEPALLDPAAVRELGGQPIGTERDAK